MTERNTSIASFTVNLLDGVLAGSVRTLVFGLKRNNGSRFESQENVMTPAEVLAKAIGVALLTYILLSAGLLLTPTLISVAIAVAIHHGLYWYRTQEPPATYDDNGLRSQQQDEDMNPELRDALRPRFF